MKALLLVIASAVVFPILSSAQTTAPQTGAAAENIGGVFWDGEFKGGNYSVRCNSIIAVSKHEYVADGVARVVEVNLTVNSAMVVRFYYLEPVRMEGGGAIGAAQGVLDKTKTLVQDTAGKVSPSLADPKVVKNYPVSTHAHTIEFVIKDEERLNSLYGSLYRSMHTGQGRSWKE